MADARQKTSAASLMRIVVRFLGMTGLLTAIGSGGYLLVSAGRITPSVTEMLKTTEGTVFLASVAVVALWVVWELFSFVFLSSGRRTAAGTTSVVQIVAAIIALVGFNIFAFSNSRKFDCTRDHRFTLPAKIVDELKTLDANSPTTVVLLQLHKSAGSLSDKPDSLDYAAEAKVVEKVQDLIEMFRTFGPQFTIVTLDTRDNKYNQKLDDLTKDKPELRTAIESAPENSILFSDVNHKVRRLGFNEFYRVDKTASMTDVKTANGQTRKEIKNLVLLPQGLEAIANRAGRDDKKPKIALATIHPELSTHESRDEYCGLGLRKSLESHGFEVVDILLKKWGGRSGPTPASETYEEYELNRTENRYNLLSMLVQDRESAIKQFTEILAKSEKATLDEFNKMRLTNIKVTTEAQKADLVKQLHALLDSLKLELAEFNKGLAELGPQYKEMVKDERAVESRRITDIKAKFKAAVADCDMLIVPRYTVMDVSKGEVIRPSLYSLSKEQAEVIRDFMKAGKPVLALFGPTNANAGGPPDLAGGADDVEKLFTQLGVEFGGQTLVYDVEAQAAAERQGDALGSGVQLPPLNFDVPPPAGKERNPVGEAFVVAARGAGSKFELNRSGFRPIYASPSLIAKLKYAPEIAFTTKEAWNEEKPTPEEDYIPKFDPAKPDDPKKGTHDEERRGPFPIGVAFETMIPGRWLDAKPEPLLDTIDPLTKAGAVGTALVATSMKDDEKVRPKIRVAALGHGGLFTGKKLDPAAETLLLTTVNWELKQDDRLAKDVPPEDRWEYPRVNLSPAAVNLWQFGGLLGLSLVSIYFGSIVWMFRRIR